MSLSHEFSIIKKDGNASDLNTNLISISDDLILYMNDSLNWVNSIWNGKKEKRGLNYYGETVIKDGDVDKLKEIIYTWIKLFELSTDNFTLTGNYLLEESKYEKNLGVFQKAPILVDTFKKNHLDAKLPLGGEMPLF